MELRHPTEPWAGTSRPRSRHGWRQGRYCRRTPRVVGAILLVSALAVWGCQRSAQMVSPDQSFPDQVTETPEPAWDEPAARAEVTRDTDRPERPSGDVSTGGDRGTPASSDLAEKSLEVGPGHGGDKTAQLADDVPATTPRDIPPENMATRDTSGTAPEVAPSQEPAVTDSPDVTQESARDRTPEQRRMPEKPAKPASAAAVETPPEADGAQVPPLPPPKSPEAPKPDVSAPATQDTVPKAPEVVEPRRTADLPRPLKPLRRRSAIDPNEVPDLPSPPVAIARSRPKGIIRLPPKAPQRPADIAGRWRQVDAKNHPDFAPGGYVSSTLVFHHGGLLEVRRAFGRDGAMVQTWRVGYEWSKDKTKLTLGKDPKRRPPAESLKGFPTAEGDGSVQSATQPLPAVLPCVRLERGRIRLGEKVYSRVLKESKGKADGK